MVAHFSDELAAHRYLEGILWPDGPVCPRCNARGRARTLNGATTRIGAYKCYACRKIFSLTSGTFFEGSHVPLHKWLQAIYLTECGTVSMRTAHLQRILNVSYKTAAAMLRKLEGETLRSNAIAVAVIVATAARSKIIPMLEPLL